MMSSSINIWPLSEKKRISQGREARIKTQRSVIAIDIVVEVEIQETGIDQEGEIAAERGMNLAAANGRGIHVADMALW